MRRTLAAVLAGIVLLTASCAGDDQRSDVTPSPTTDAADSRGCDAANAVTAGAERLEVDAGGVTREVARVVPPSYDATTPHPLILNLHGFSSNIEQQELFSGLPQAAAARGYILLTPQAAPATLSIRGEEIRAPYWNMGLTESTVVADAQDDLAFLTELIDTTSSELCVDQGRIYVTGNSNGAGMSVALACALPGRIAAIAPVSGVNLAAPCEDPEAVSVIAFHGDADPLVPYDGEPAEGTQAANPSVEVRMGELAAAAGCAPESEESSPFDDVTLRRWTGCRDGVDVELYTIIGGGHTWPGMLNYVDVQRLAEQAANSQRLVDAAGVDLGRVAGHMTVNLEATATMLDFFEAHRRP